jgi:hypothetical protein
VTVVAVAGRERQQIFHFSFKIFHFVIAERDPSVHGKWKMENGKCSEKRVVSFSR